MKKLFLIAFALILAYNNSVAIEDTLTYWAKQSGISTYNNPAITMQWAHFYPEAPCHIKKVIVWFYGNAGTANMYIVGQEAGSSVPEVVINSNGATLWGRNGLQFSAQPTTAVANIVEITPNVYIDGNQFFVGFTSISSGMYLATDEVTKSPWCESSDGGTYRYQALFVNDGQQSGWALGEYAYAIDVIVDYPRITPAYHFRDITEDYLIPTNLSRNSIAVADYNNDNFLDLLISGKLYENINGQYFEDVTIQCGLNGSPSGNAFVDTDNDGDLDILFLMQGSGNPSKLFINNGDGTFDEKTLNIPELNSVTCFSIADINNDMLPDLFIGQLWKTYPQSLPNYMLLNDGNNDFTDNTTLLYPDYDGTWNYPNENWDPDNYIVDKNRNSRGSQWVDFDNDGDLDLFVTNYFLQWDEFYRNNGDGSFTDIISQKNIDVHAGGGHNHGTGVDWFDYDNDGDMDLLLSQFAHPRFLQIDHRPLTIYKNGGESSYNFTDTYDPDEFESTIGLGYEETYAGAAWGDVNNDGLADFIATTYYGCRFIDFYQQKDGNTFENRTFEYGLEGIVTGEDACWLDFDNDGKLDLAMSIDRKFRLFKNYYDLNFDWLELDLQGKKGQENYIIGARVKVYTDKGTYMQEISCGRGQKMQKPSRLHFGLGKNATIEKVEVRWPGTTGYEEFFGINKNMIVKLIQDKGGEPEAPEPPILSLPFDGATDINIKADNFKWNSVSNADKYYLQVSESSAFTNLVLDETNINKTEFPMSDLEGEKEYYWRVSAGNFVGYGDWSEEWSFTTTEVITEVPEAPTLITPDDGAINVNLNSDKLQWSEVPDAKEYNLQVSENISFDPTSLDIEHLTVTEFPVSDLNENSSNYWRVRAWNTAGYGEWSSIRNFVTDDSRVDYPLAPVLLTPENGEENVRQDAYMTWEVGEGATKYQLQVSTHYSISQEIVIDKIIRQNRYPVEELQGETKHYWQVYSINSRGKSEMPSLTSNFTTGIFSKVEELAAPAENVFIQNPAPNPVSDISELKFGITKKSFVSLQILDINGRILETIISKNMSPGTYLVTWPANNITSGFYYIKLSAGIETVTTKLIVIK
jgi:hypothetical protein